MSGCGSKAGNESSASAESKQESAAAGSEVPEGTAKNTDTEKAKVLKIGYVDSGASSPNEALSIAMAAIAAANVGAKLINLEFPNTHAGSKFFERCGKATWIGVISGPDGKAVGPFVKKPDKELGDITADVWHSVFEDKMKDGTGPVYMNLYGNGTGRSGIYEMGPHLRR